MEVEAINGEWDGYSEPLPQAQETYMEAPLLTLWQLMPGATGGNDDETDLDLTFRANKVEFIVTQRQLCREEKEVDIVLKDAADVDWSIPTPEEFEDIMGHTMDTYTGERPELVHVLSWSSVGAATGVGCFSVKTGKMEDLDAIRGTLRTVIVAGMCFESFPCLLYTSPSPRDRQKSRMPSSA